MHCLTEPWWLAIYGAVGVWARLFLYAAMSRPLQDVSCNLYIFNIENATSSLRDAAARKGFN